MREQVEAGGLARAVGADERVDASAPDLEADVADGDEALDLLPQGARFENDVSRHECGEEPVGSVRARKGGASGECRHYRSRRGAGRPGQQAEIATRRRGIHGKYAFGREPHEVIRSAGLRSGAGQPLAAERLHAHHCADHVAVDIEIADRRASANALGAGVHAAVHTHRKPVSRRVDVLDHPVEVFEGESRYVKDGTETLPGNLAYRADRKSTRLNSSHSQISYAVFCLKKKKKDSHITDAKIK